MVAVICGVVINYLQQDETNKVDTTAVVGSTILMMLNVSPSPGIEKASVTSQTVQKWGSSAAEGDKFEGWCFRVFHRGVCYCLLFSNAVTTIM